MDRHTRSSRIRTFRKFLNEQVNYDEWEYLEDPESGIGIVINHFRDDGEPSPNVYIVPTYEGANKDWHSDMYMIDENACFCEEDKEMRN